MKKIMMVCLMAMSLVLPVALSAQTNLSASDVDVFSVRRILAQKYSCQIDDDGDIILKLSDNTKVVVTVIPKAKLIRIWAGFSAYEERTLAEMILIANKFNYDKRFLRATINPKTKGSVIDYYIVYNGGLNSTNLLESVDWFSVLKKSWNSYVVNGGDDED